MATLIAHRGSSIEAPENTLASIQRAIEHQVDYIEIDIQLTKDLVPIIFHDSTTGRTTDCKQNAPIELMTLRDFEMLDAGSWFHKDYAGEKVPTLAQVLQLDFRTSNLMLEIKKGNHPVDIIVERVLQTLFEAHNPSLLEHCLIGSFDHRIIERINKCYPHLKVKGIVETHAMLPPFLLMSVNHITFHYKLVNPSLVADLHAQNKKVWAYTIDERSICERLLSMNVDGIITNDPRNIGKLLRCTTRV